MRALTELKKECFRRIGALECFCCDEPKFKRLLAHHLSYTSKSVTYNKWGNSDDERLKYYSNLLDEIKEDNTNFLVMCFNCHKKLEELLKLSYDDVLKWAQSEKSNVELINAYNKTRQRRNQIILENPEDFVSLPEFLISFISDWQIIIDNGTLNQYNIAGEVKQLALKIESKELSLCDLSRTAILGDYPQNYIKPYPTHVTAALLLESIREVKKGDKIKFVRIINHPYSKPIELVRKAEIDSLYYMSLFKSVFLRAFHGIFDKNDFEIMIGEPKRTGLDEFFWS